MANLKEIPELIGAKVRIGSTTGKYQDHHWYGIIMKLRYNPESGFICAHIYSVQHHQCHPFEITADSSVYLITEDGKPAIDPSYKEILNEDITREIDRVQSCTPTSLYPDEELATDYPTLYSYVQDLNKATKVIKCFS